MPFAKVRRPAELTKHVGIDVRGFRHSASNQAIRHTFTKHGARASEVSRGLLPVEHSDIALLPQIVREGQYSAGKARKFGPPRFQIDATIQGYHYTYIGEVRNGQKRLDLISLWKR